MLERSSCPCFRRRILTFAGADATASMAGASSSMRRICADDRLWGHHCHEELPEFSIADLSANPAAVWSAGIRWGAHRAAADGVGEEDIKSAKRLAAEEMRSAAKTHFADDKKHPPTVKAPTRTRGAPAAAPAPAPAGAAAAAESGDRLGHPPSWSHGRGWADRFRCRRRRHDQAPVPMCCHPPCRQQAIDDGHRPDEARR